MAWHGWRVRGWGCPVLCMGGPASWGQGHGGVGEPQAGDVAAALHLLAEVDDPHARPALRSSPSPNGLQLGRAY